MKRKLGIIQAFQANPPLLILDEPTEGLDPLMQESFYGLLADVKRGGATVFMSSHVLSEVERVCDRIALLRKGEMVLLSSVRESRRLAPRRVRVLFSEDVSAPPELPPGHQLTEKTPRLWRLAVAGPLGPLLALLEGLPVEDMEIGRGPARRRGPEILPRGGLMSSAFLLFRLSLKRARMLLCATGLLLAGFQALRVHIAASHSAGDYEQIAALLPPSVRTILGPSVASVMSFNGIVCGGYFDLGIVIALVVLTITLATLPAV